MYTILYTKIAIKDIEKLKSAQLEDKAKDLIRLIKENPFTTPPR